MHMRTASVLPFKLQPVASDSKDSSIEGLDELHDSAIEEPVCEGWVFDDSIGTGRPGIGVIRADELSQLWPLEVRCTVGKEDGGETQCINHGEQTTPLTLPVLLGAT